MSGGQPGPDPTAPLNDWIAWARAGLERSLRGAGARRAREALDALGVTAEDRLELARSLRWAAGPERPVHAWKQSAEPLGIAAGGVSLERVVVAEAALASLARVPALRVGASVKREICRAFRFFASPPDVSLPAFHAGTASFASMCKVATLRRFPAGQFEWEVSGLPRSWLLRVPPRSLPRVLGALALELRGLAPLLEPHYAVCGPRRLVLSREEAMRSYHRMARALELQPELRGMIAAAWFFGPEIEQVGPHLAWLREFFLAEGATVTTAGPDDDPAAMQGSAERRRRIESGEYRPTRGLVLWPRAAMLRWAGAHPEWADPAEARGAA